MGVSPGDRLGRYELLSLVGRGGMGEVYKARDGRLDRLVAVKVLLAAVHESDRVARFEREARTISALEHPNICAIYDVGETNGIPYIVLQFLEGQTLAERLRRGPLTVGQAVRHGVEIADALDRAHRVGVIHRDLKPSNIMLTKAGAKLLDFGLARLHDDPGPIGLSSMTRLGDRDITSDGAVLGTYQYMAPEQLEGRKADQRTDIFALGAVLFEAVTGNPAFPGPTTASVIGAILKDDPPLLNAQSPVAPPALEQLVRTCLEKNPEERWQSTADLKRQLQWIDAARTTPSGPVPVPARRRRIGRWLGAAALAAAPIAVALTLWRPAVEGTPVRFFVYPPDRSTFAGPIAQVPHTQFALSPDGRELVFVATAAGGPARLWVRALDATEPRPLKGTEDASFPFWSPDGKFVAFFAGNQLKRIARDGTELRRICDVGVDPRGGAWSVQNQIVFTPDIASGLFRVNADGGSPESLLPLERGHTSYRWPSFLPDGRRFLFHVKGATRRSIRLGSLDGGTSSALVLEDAPYAGVYAASGYLLTVRDGTLLAYPFDPGSLPIRDEGIRIADNVGGSTMFAASFSVSAGGVLAHAGPLLIRSHLAWFDRGGTSLGPATDIPADFVSVRLSPDGRRAAMTRVDEQLNTTDIWTLDLVSRIPDRFIPNPATDAWPVWSHDGQRIRFRSDRSGPHVAFERPADKSAAERNVSDVETQFMTDWSTDGKYVAFHGSAKTVFNVGVLDVTSNGAAPHFVVPSPSTGLYGRFSPDRKWFAYCSDESGEMQVYVGPYPSGPGRPLSSIPGCEPYWREDGRELYYLSRDGHVMAVPVGPGAGWTFGSPLPLFKIDVQLSANPYRMNYDVSPNGRRFLVIAPVQHSPSAVTVVLNWASELKRATGR
jgi:Tol biopolymer transport system component